MKTTIINTNKTRTINGTDFPITEQVYKSGNKWIFAIVCNGTAEHSKEFKTKKDALQYAQN